MLLATRNSLWMQVYFQEARAVAIATITHWPAICGHEQISWWFLN